MRRHPLIVTAASLSLLASACGDDGSAADGSSGDGGAPTIVATTTILGDVVSGVTGGFARVEVIMPASADPHDFQPSARQAAAAREADLLVANGAGFEEGLEDTIHGAEDDGVVVFEAIDHVSTLPAGAGGDDEPADDDHEGVDPHFFTDPTRMAAAAEALADTLVDTVPALDTSEFRDRSAAYVADLQALDGEVETILAAVPDERRKLVTNHDVFAYFADRYGFEVVGAVVPSTTTQAAPSAGALDDLAATITAEGVPAVFADTSSPEDLADALADEVGDVAVVELFSESLGEAGSGADSYAGMIRTNAARVADALAP